MHRPRPGRPGRRGLGALASGEVDLVLDPPFKDLRMRQAVGHALNIDLIIDKVLRGQAEAGYPNGFAVTPDCVNVNGRGSFNAGRYSNPKPTCRCTGASSTGRWRRTSTW